jgi:murein DD-endopeptidase MepM/ murein hydrolase activator NlpD
MKYWPVPKSYSKGIPKKGHPGSFWENREDRYHCGIDIYAPAGSEVLSIDDEVVKEIGVFTSPKTVSYWNDTKYVLMKNQAEFYCKYAELKDVVVKENDSIIAGQIIGHIGLVLNIKKINNRSPTYIQRIKNDHTPSMLHFELYSSPPVKAKDYLGGNWFGATKPKNLLDPTTYLSSE